MAVSKMSNKKKQQCYISVPSQIINSISSSSIESLVLHSPKKKSSSSSKLKLLMIKNPRFWLFLLVIFSFIGTLKMLPFPSIPCTILQEKALNSNGYASFQKINGATSQKDNETFEKDGALIQKFDVKDEKSEGLALNSNGYASFQQTNAAITQKTDENFEKDGAFDQNFDVKDENFEGFWKQPDGMGYKPCLEFTGRYRRESEEIVVKSRSKYLMVVVSGGLNQQRNQIVDAVVIARILGAALVVPILQVNVIWGDESEFSEIFDLAYFKKVLENDVRIVSSLPSTHLMTRPVEEKRLPLNVSPQWIRSRYLKRIRREGVLLLRGLDSRLSKDLPSDLQKLRCKVAFHALRFAPPILELGNKLTERMRSKGPYLALHLRMEKDVWVRTGCLPGLSHKYDEMIKRERKLRPELLTSRSNMSYHDRKLMGLCPLNAFEVTRLLKALGAPESVRIYWAGGNPLGGMDALQPLITEFPHFYNKEDLALPGELDRFAKKASSMAAIDYIVSENSDVFMPSHGGNMGRAIQGHRAYAGHKKTITPNKREMLSHFLNSSLSEAEFNRIIMDLHQESFGQPELRTSKAGRDVTKYPIPECMCNSSTTHTVK